MPATDLREVYVARLTMSSPNASTLKPIDEMTAELTYDYEKKVREAIRTVRGRFRRQIHKNCLHFLGLKVVSAETREAVDTIVTEANVEMRKIDPALHATVIWMPVPVDVRGKGELLEAMTAAIHGQIFSELLDRLGKLAGKKDLPERSRKALLDFCDRAETWNVLGDRDVAKTIAKYRSAFSEGVFANIATEVEKVVENLESPAAYLEI